MYLKYGEDYKTPCIRYSVDAMNDKATEFSASQFFTDLKSVQAEMLVTISKLWDEKCGSTITTLQITSANLPYLYENALLRTQIADQDGITAERNKENIELDMVTRVNAAKVIKDLPMIDAQAKVKAELDTNLAQAQAYFDVTQAEVESYAEMKRTLSFGKKTDSILNYIKVKTINEYNANKLYIGIVDL